MVEMTENGWGLIPDDRNSFFGKKFKRINNDDERHLKTMTRARDRGNCKLESLEREYKGG